jgi:hypothetical protein
MAKLHRYRIIETTLEIYKMLSIYILIKVIKASNKKGKEFWKIFRLLHLIIIKI